MSKSRAALAALILLIVAAVGMGRSTTASIARAADAAASTPAPSATPVLVTIKDFAFVPAVVSIPVGGSVTFKNLDQAAHTATDAKGSFDSGNLDTGKSFTETFKKAGVYNIVCTYHPSMHGIVAVGVPAPSTASTPDPSGY